MLVGAHRARHPSDTIARIRPHLPSMGITRVANVTGLDTIGVPTVLAFRPNSRSLSVSQGKGLDLDSAKASAIMESVEHFHAERVELPLRLLSYRELSGSHRVADVARLPAYVRPFTEHLRLLWVESTELNTGHKVQVPFDLVHVNLTLPLPPGSGCFPLGSNGLSSGNTLSETLAHGLWELIERDAVALFYRLPAVEQSQRRLRLDTVQDPGAVGVLKLYTAAGIRVAVWDITSDVGVAAFYCTIVERELNPFRLVGKAVGFGCHLDRGVALCRALCEAAQSRLTRITGSRDDIQRADFDEIRSQDSIRRQQLELDAQGDEVRSFLEVPSLRLPSFEDDLANTAARLAEVGMSEVLYVDLSRSDLPVHVVRVLVPGLEGTSDLPGYVPGARARALDDRCAGERRS